MIWGMTLEPGKLYTEIMGEEVQLSMAAIDSRKDLADGSNSFCQIMMKTSKSEYVLCTLVHGVMFQQSLDLKLMPREKVTFSVQGPNVVYLVGYTASYPEDSEMDMEDEMLETVENSWEPYEEQDEQLLVLRGSTEDPPVVEPDAKVLMPQTAEDHTQLQDNTSNESRQVPVVKTEPEQPHEPVDLPQDRTSQGLDEGVVKTEVLPTGSSQEGFYRSQGGELIPKTEPEESYTGEFFYAEEQMTVNAPGSYHTGSLSDVQHQDPSLGEILPIAEPFGQTQDAFVQGTQVTSAASVPMTALQRAPMPPRRQPRTQPRAIRGKAGKRPRNSSPMQHMTPGPSTSGGGLLSIASENTRRKQPTPHHYPQSNSSSNDAPASSSADPSAPIKCYFCLYCNKQFLDQEKLRAHERCHKNKQGRVGYLCRFCSRGFSNTGAVKLHERTHTGEKPFTCKFCMKSFSQKGNLQRHERTHTGGV